MKAGDEFVIIGNALNGKYDTEVEHCYELGTVVKCINPVPSKYQTNGVEVIEVRVVGGTLEQFVEQRHIQPI